MKSHSFNPCPYPKTVGFFCINNHSKVQRGHKWTLAASAVLRRTLKTKGSQHPCLQRLQGTHKMCKFERLWSSFSKSSKNRTPAGNVGCLQQFSLRQRAGCSGCCSGNYKPSLTLSRSLSPCSKVPPTHTVVV